MSTGVHKEVIRQIQERREQLESCYSKGMLSYEELLRNKTGLYHELTIKLSGAGSKEDMLSFEERLDLCGLNMEEIISSDTDNRTDHDPLPNGSVCVFKGLIGLEELILENDPEGKHFTFQLSLTCSGERIWKDFQFEVKRKKAGTDRWQGWTVYEGMGRFLVYSGEGSLIVRKKEGLIQSVLYQKCYL